MDTLNRLDDFDVRILKILERDGRIAFSAIATELEVSNTMVHQRVTRLLDQGLLLGVRPVLNEKALGYDWGHLRVLL